ncbi:uncharacterized protein LOC126668466 [Mercurialis annua]|uniref:uncharacterized protein LOC126668466 n=1 Tax=Mercurialis annua TaxID=3986 RepID=UPI00215EA03A|nr:uncharacterized protein LOC126668466 [Mercurialis annua]
MGSQDKYLGIPALVSKSKTETFREISLRVRQKVASWKGNLISYGGREVLIKSLATTVPVFSMLCFLLPKGIHKEINKFISNFWWGRKNEERKMHWVSWKNMCLTKEAGWLGFRDLEHFNLVLLAKQGWRIVNQSNSLLARVLKGKYFPHGSFMEAELHSNSSLAGEAYCKAGMCSNEVPWLPIKPPFTVSPSTMLPHNIRRVSNLLATDKRLVWHFSKSGQFTVNSAYHLSFGESNNSGTTPEQGACWKDIWSSLFVKLTGGENRNEILTKDTYPIVVNRDASELQCEFSSAVRREDAEIRRANNSPPLPNAITRTPPPQHIVKINCDGAFKSELLCGVGACVATRHQGKVIASMARKFTNIASSLMVEAMAFREAIQFARRMRVDNLIFEGDAKSLALVFQFVRRNCNWAAHLVAKKALREHVFCTNPLAQVMWLESRLC